MIDIRRRCIRFSRETGTDEVPMVGGKNAALGESHGTHDATARLERSEHRRTLQSISLPKPSARSNMSLAKALQLRCTCRRIRSQPLSRRALSDLLWAACGINRADGPFAQPGRTAASASNSQEIDVYVLLPEGAYFYNAFAHALLPVAKGDLRPLALSSGQREARATACTQLVYVVDIDRLRNTRGYREPGLSQPEVQRSYYCVDVGLIAANVYLHAAANGLAAWFHNCDRRRLARKLRVTSDQRVLFAQSVGYPRSRS
ncbi:MAG: nitroreductase family protein [Steroidobacteraceae bacterium]